MKKYKLIIGMILLSTPAIASQKVVCGRTDAEVNTKLDRIPNIQSISSPSIAIAKAAPHGVLNYSVLSQKSIDWSEVESETLICVSVKY